MYKAKYDLLHYSRNYTNVYIGILLHVNTFVYVCIRVVLIEQLSYKPG